MHFETDTVILSVHQTYCDILDEFLRCFPFYCMFYLLLCQQDTVYNSEMLRAQETPVLRYHSIRPGDRLAFYSKQTVRKLKATVNDRYFFIPVSHKGQFTFLDGASTNLPVMLAELAATDTTFPFRMQYQKCAGASTDHGLPCDVPLTVRGLVAEDVVLATKIFELKTLQAFQLPLRTRITVGVERDAGDKTKRKVLMSEANSYAEEVSDDVFNGSGIYQTFSYVFA